MHAGAPTGACYRVSPGSWPDFARIADCARLTTGPIKRGAVHRSSALAA